MKAQGMTDSIVRQDTQETSGRRRRAIRCAAASLLLLAVTQLFACSPAKPNTTQTLTQNEGNLDRSLILSGSPDRDAAAYNASEEKLSSADWRELEKLGPRPIWEQLELKKRQCHTRQMRFVTGAPKPPTTRPTTQPTLDESELPVQTVTLPDGKVRLIWTLRSFGGTTVTSTRDAATARRNVVAAPPDLTPLVNVLTQTVGPNAVNALPRENTVVVTCEPKLKQVVLELLDRLDVPPRQVEITAKIFEVSHDFDFQQGTELVLNRLATDSSQGLSSTFSAKRFLDAVQNPSSGPVQGSVLHLLQAFQSAGIQLDVSFQFLQDAGMVNVVSSPRMTVAAGQTGYMLAGQEVPIQSSSIVNNVVQIGTQYKPVGVQLYITPEAIGLHRVKLHTISIVSAISGFTPQRTMEGGTHPVVNPVIDSREAETAVTVEDGSTLVISGLQMVRTITRENKIPGLGDIPVLGWLFKNHRTQQEHTDLYFFITPAML